MLPLLLLLTTASITTPQDSVWRAEAAEAKKLELPKVDDSNLIDWRTYLEPRAEELAFEEIPWIASFSEGLRAAERAQRPLLFWAMNGHPLACT